MDTAVVAGAFAHDHLRVGGRDIGHELGGVGAAQHRGFCPVVRDDDFAVLSQCVGESRRWCNCESVTLVRRCYALLPPGAKYLRAHSFRVLTNSLYSARRWMPVVITDKATRDAATRVPCWLCGKGDDGVEHVGGACDVTDRARSLFTPRTGIDITPAGLGVPRAADVFMMNVLAPSWEVALALFVFNKAVWDESRSFFAALGEVQDVATAGARVAEVAATLYAIESHKLARGKAKRSPEQTKAALAYASELIERLKKGGLHAYTDGSSHGNPGHSGSGVCFAEAGVPLPAYV